jgi:hypothetical protein
MQHFHAYFTAHPWPVPEFQQRSPVSLQKTSVHLTKAPESTPRAHAKRDSLSEWTRWRFNQSPTWRHLRRI